MRDINPDPYGPAQRSIRNVPVNHHRTRDLGSEPPARVPKVRGRRSRRIWIWGGILVIVCAIAGLLISTVFAGATVHVSPRTATVTPPATIAATLNAPTGTLAYQMVSATQWATTTVAASGTQNVSTQASGVITINNSYSTSPQRLIANTRFEAPDGKIYRIHDSVTVPGMTGSTPGTITATIYADSPGDSYNKSGTTTFTIPGFQGDPRYTKFSATSEGSISGGFVGTQPAVAASDLASAKATLESQLNSSATAAAASTIPSGDTAIPGTLSVAFGDPAQAPAGSGQATIAMSATAQGAIVRANDLASFIAAKTVQGYNGEAVALDPSSALQVQASTSTLAQGTLTLQLSGTATLVWQFDPNALKQAILGKPKSQFQTILQSFAPAISCTSATPCSASIRPFWMPDFPSDASKISVVVVSPSK